MDRPSARSGTRDIAKLALGSGAAQFFSVLATPLVTRLYDPAAYAAWAIIISIVVVLGVFATMRFELAVVLPKEHREAAPVACLGAFLCIAVSLASVPLFFVDGFTHAVLSIDGIRGLPAWVPLLTALTGLNQIANYWCTRSQRFSVLAKAALVLAVATLFGQMAAVSTGYQGAEGLLFGTALGTFASIVFQLASVIPEDRGYFAGTWRSAALRDAALRHRNYPCYMAPYTLVGVVRDRLVLFFLGASGNATETGYYAFANRMVSLPVSLISSAIRPVVFRKASLEGLAQVEDLLVSVMRFIVLVATPLWLFLLFWAPELFALAFGARWRDAGAYAVLLAFPAYAQLLANWLDRLLDAAGKQRLAFVMELAFSFLAIAVFSGMVYFRIDLRMAVAIQAGIITAYNLYWIHIIFRLGHFGRARLYELARLFALIAGAGTIVLGFGPRVLPTGVVIASYAVLTVVYLGFVARRFRAPLLVRPQHG